MNQQVLLHWIKKIITQYLGPIKVNYTVTATLWFTTGMVEEVLSKLETDNLDTLSQLDIFGIYLLIDYAIKFLWSEEFETCTGLTISEWLYIYRELRAKLLNNWN